VKFREKLSQFPDAASTSRLRPNEDVLAIKAKFVREFWLTSGKEVARTSLVLAKMVATAVAATVILEKTLDVKNLYEGGYHWLR
jgi:hypothetical protein